MDQIFYQQDLIYNPLLWDLKMSLVSTTQNTPKSQSKSVLILRSDAGIWFATRMVQFGWRLWCVWLSHHPTIQTTSGLPKNHGILSPIAFSYFGRSKFGIYYYHARLHTGCWDRTRGISLADYWESYQMTGSTQISHTHLEGAHTQWCTVLFGDHLIPKRAWCHTTSRSQTINSNNNTLVQQQRSVILGSWLWIHHHRQVIQCSSLWILISTCLVKPRAIRWTNWSHQIRWDRWVFTAADRFRWQWMLHHMMWWCSRSSDSDMGFFF